MATSARHDNIYKVYNEEETYYATEQYLNLCGFDLKIEPDAQTGTLDHYGDHYMVVRADNEKYGWDDDNREHKTLRCCYDQLFYPNTQMLACPSIGDLESLGIRVEDECDDGRYYEDEEEEEYKDVYQTFFIDPRTVEFLKRHTREMIFYAPDLDMFILGVSHYGTEWSCCEAELAF